MGRIETLGKVEDLSHEFYNLGHMVEGAVAHYQATGQKNFLNIAIRYADCVCREIGDKPGQQVKVPGHQIAEMALAKLYVVTGDKNTWMKRNFSWISGDIRNGKTNIARLISRFWNRTRPSDMLSGLLICIPVSPMSLP